MKTYDIFFNDSENSNNKGFKCSYDAAMNYINRHNGTNWGYFSDYKNGTVSIVDNETGETVYEEEIYADNSGEAEELEDDQVELEIAKTYEEQVELTIAKTYEDAKLFAEDILDCEEIEIEGNSYPNEYNGFCRCKCGLTLLYYFHEINDLCNITTIGVCENCGESYYTIIDELEDLCRRQ